MRQIIALLGSFYLSLFVAVQASDSFIEPHIARTQLLKYLRDGLFETRTDLASALGVSPATVSRFLNNAEFLCPSICRRFEDFTLNLHKGRAFEQATLRHYLKLRVGRLAEAHAVRPSRILGRLALKLGVSSPTLRSFLDGAYSLKTVRHMRILAPQLTSRLLATKSEGYGYHLTRVENLESIGNLGLRCDYSQTGFCANGAARTMEGMKERAHNKIFGTRNYGNILRYQIHHAHPLAILRFPIRSLELHDDPDDHGSFYIQQNMPPQNIQVLVWPSNINDFTVSEVEAEGFVQWIPVSELHKSTRKPMSDIGTGLWFSLTEGIKSELP